MNTKPFFWESETIPDNYHKFYSPIGIIYKYILEYNFRVLELILEPLKDLNQIFWVIEFSRKDEKCKS